MALHDPARDRMAAATSVTLTHRTVTVTNDKPAKLIRKLQDLVNAKDDEIARLRAEAARVPERIQGAVDAANRTTANEIQELRLALADEVNRHDADLRASTDEYVEMVRRNRELNLRNDAQGLKLAAQIELTRKRNLTDS